MAEDRPGAALDAALEKEERARIEADSHLARALAALSIRVAALENAPADPGPVDPPPPPPPPPPSGVFPQGNAANPILQIGLRQHTDWASISPYKSWHLFVRPSNLFDLIEAGKFDPKTGWYTLGADEEITLGRLNNPLTKGFVVDQGVWVISAAREGTAFIRAGNLADAGSTADRVRIALDITGVTGAWQVNLRGGAQGGRIRVDFWGPEKFEADPDGWHPAYVRETSRDHIIRGMDWFLPALSKTVIADQWVDDDDYYPYAPSSGWNRIPTANDDKIRGGYSFGRFFDLANKADAAAWINLPMYIGTEAFRSLIVEIENRENVTTRNEEIEALRLAILADFPTYKRDAQREWRRIADRIIDSAERQHYPLDKVLLIEIGNEWWNRGTPHFAAQQRFTNIIGEAAAGNDRVGFGAGYITAIAVEAIRERFAARRSQQDVKFVAGWHTGAAGDGKGGLGLGGDRAHLFADGFAAYKPDYADDLLQVFGGTTSYWGGGDFKWTSRGNAFGAADEAAFNAAFETADRADRKAMFRLIRDWSLGPASGDNVARVVENTILLRDVAIARGMRGVINYEGGGHFNVRSEAGDLGAVYPPAHEAAVEFIRSPEARDVQRAMIKAMAAIDPINPAVTTGWAPRTLVVSNYHDFGLELTSGQPWLERTADEMDAPPADGLAAAWLEFTRAPRVLN